LFATFALETIFALVRHVKIVFFIQKHTNGGIKISLAKLIIRSQRKAILVTNFKTLAVMNINFFKIFNIKVILHFPIS
jgi:hypothetical protein